MCMSTAKKILNPKGWLIAFLLFHTLSITFVDTLPYALDDDRAKESIAEDYNATMAEDPDFVTTYQEAVFFNYIMMMMVVPLVAIGAFWMKGKAQAKTIIGVGIATAMAGTLFGISGSLFSDGFDFPFLIFHIILSIPMIVGGYLWLQDDEPSDSPTEA